MKEFNLEEAKAGKAVCTRDGRPVRIICWDRKGDCPIIALVEDKDCGETIAGYKENGHVWCHCSADDMTRYDLMMTSEKKEGWVNLYKEKDGSLGCSMIRCSKEEAVSHIIHKRIYVDTIKIEWEE